MRNPFRYFNSSPEVIRLTVMMYIRYPLSLRQVEDLLFERGVDICHETVRFWWNRFGPMFAAEIRKRRVHHRSHSNWRWHLDEVFVKINGETHFPWRMSARAVITGASSSLTVMVVEAVAVLPAASVTVAAGRAYSWREVDAALRASRWTA